MNRSPAAQLEAKANREQQKLLKVHDELLRVGQFVKTSDLPTEVKLRLYAALKNETEIVAHDKERIVSLRKAVEISRGPQWVTSGDKQ